MKFSSISSFTGGIEMADKPVQTKIYTLIGYETSGNEDDGFKVDSAGEMDTITIEEPITPWAINNALAEKGIWEQATLNCMLDAILQEDECYLLEDENDGRPVGKLVPVPVKTLANNTCPKCGGTVTGEQVEFISSDKVTQDVTCNDCGYIFRHYYKLYDVEEI